VLDMSTIITAPAAESQALRARRIALGLTQRQLAASAAVSLTWLANIEAGCVPNQSEAVERIRAALDAAEHTDYPHKQQRPGGDQGAAEDLADAAAQAPAHSA